MNGATSLQAKLVRAARAAHFKQPEPDNEVNATPPSSEREWIDDLNTRVVTLVYYAPVVTKGEPRGVYECRLWIAPDASRFAAWYSVVY